MFFKNDVPTAEFLIGCIRHRLYLGNTLSVCVYIYIEIYVHVYTVLVLAQFGGFNG